MTQNQILEYHILQSFPVSCLNRDDVGSPKTAMVGGVERARVSSQCWKRQVRLAMQGFLDASEGCGKPLHLGVRTKRMANMIADACRTLGASEAEADDCGKVMEEMLAKDTLFFASSGECEALAQIAQEHGFKLEGNAKAKKALTKAIAKKLLTKPLCALDIALFGRMVAMVPDLNVEAAAAFSHAISTHKVTPELDFFTALDDRPLPEECGSAHMGTNEFNSATYYRYVSLNLGQLAKTLGIDRTTKEGAATLRRAVEVFTRALFVAVPVARQATQSAACLWDYAHVYVRHGQRLQASFDRPVRSDGTGFLAPSIEALEKTLSTKEEQIGSLFGKEAEFVWGAAADFSVDDLVQGIAEAV